MSATSSSGAARRSPLTRRELLGRGGRLAAVAAAGAAAPTLLTSCGGSSGESESGPLSFWNFYGPAPGNSGVPAQSDWFVNTAKAWNKSHKTQVKLHYIPNADYINGSKLQTAFSAGKGPDIFLISPGDFLRYYNGGVLQDLTPYMSDEAQKDFFPNVMGTRTVDGKIYGLPMEVEPMAFYYDKKAWEKVGLSEGDIPATWDDLLNVAGRLKKGKRYGLTFETTPGYYQNFTWYPFMWEGGGDAVMPDQKSSAFDSKAAINALGLWRDTIKEDLAPRKLLGTGGGDIAANLGTGYCGIQNCGIWGVAALRAKKNLDYGVFKLPVPPGGSYKTVLGGWAFVVNKKGKNPEEAAKFVVWALGSMKQHSIDRVVDWCIKAKSDIAPRKSALDQAEKMGGYESGELKYFKDEVFPGGRGEPRYPPEVYHAISNALQACQLSGADPTKQANKAADSIDNYMQSYSGAKIR
ncbi:MAG: ABC transporter substrate-binding protein [Nocardioidaceae bacterium]